MYWINLIGTTIVSMIASYIFTCNVSSVDLKTVFTKKKISIYLLLNIVFFLNLMFFDGINKVLLNFFILVLLNLTVIFDYDYKKSTFYSLIFFIVSSFAEIIIAFCFSLIFNFSRVDYQNIKLNMLLFTMLNTIFIIFMSKEHRLKSIISKLSKIISDKVKSFIFMIFVTMYIIVLCMNNLILLSKNINYYINFGFFIFVFVTSIVLVYNVINKSKIEDKYNQMLEYVSKYENIINEQGKRNHEFNNQLMVLQGYINDKKKLKEYLNIIIDDQKGGQNFRIKQLGYLPDGGLKGLLYYKLSKMEEKKIKSFLYVNQNLKNSFKNISVDFYRDITKIFGVFIDNAIDAASEADKKEIVIDIRKDDDSLIIIINNTYKENKNINKIGKKGYTSKGSGHGFGLSIVSDITKRNDQIESFSDIEDGMFKQTLIIYLK